MHFYIGKTACCDNFFYNAPSFGDIAQGYYVLLIYRLLDAERAQGFFMVPANDVFDTRTAGFGASWCRRRADIGRVSTPVATRRRLKYIARWLSRLGDYDKAVHKKPWPDARRFIKSAALWSL